MPQAACRGNCLGGGQSQLFRGFIGGGRRNGVGLRNILDRAHQHGRIRIGRRWRRGQRNLSHDLRRRIGRADDRHRDISHKRLTGRFRTAAQGTPHQRNRKRAQGPANSCHPLPHPAQPRRTICRQHCAIRPPMEAPAELPFLLSYQGLNLHPGQRRQIENMLGTLPAKPRPLVAVHVVPARVTGRSHPNFVHLDRHFHTAVGRNLLRNAPGISGCE